MEEMLSATEKKSFTFQKVILRAATKRFAAQKAISVPKIHRAAPKSANC